MKINDLLSAMAFDSATIETPDKDLCEATLITYLSSKGVKMNDLSEILDFINFKISRNYYKCDIHTKLLLDPFLGLQGRFKEHSRISKNIT